MNNLIRGALAPSRAGRLVAAAFTLILAGPALGEIDLTTTFTAPESYTPGTSANYTIVVENTGGTDETGLVVTTGFAEGATVTNAQCEDQGGSSDNCSAKITNGDLDTTNNSVEAGGSVTWTLEVAFESDMVANPLDFTAAVDSSVDSEGATSAESSTLALESDLGVTKSPKSPSDATYVPGGRGTFDIVATNHGDSDATGVVLEDVMPTGMNFVGWTCNGSGSSATCPDVSAWSATSAPFDLPADENLAFVLEVDYDSNLRTASLTNTATITAAEGVVDDPIENNTASIDLQPDPQVNLVTTLTPDSPSGQTSYTPGTPEFGDGNAANDLLVTVVNTDSSDAFGTSVSIELLPAVQAADWTCGACTTTSGSVADGDDITVSADIPAGTSIEVDVALDFASSAIVDPLQITASATPAAAETETDPDDNSATNAYAIDRRAAISVDKVANAATVNPGAAFNYSITVTNAGPSDVGQGPDEGGVLVTDLVSGDLVADPGECSSDEIGVCFFVCPTDDGVTDQTVTRDNCTVEVQERRGSLSNESLHLSAGKSNEILLFAKLGGALDSGDTVDNTASIEVDPSDDVTEIDPEVDNSSTATIEVEISTDLAVTKTDGAIAATPGDEHAYTVTVANDGIQTANEVSVDDVFPIFGDTLTAGFESGSVRWQCRAFDGACCNSGTSNCGASEPTAEVFADALAGHLVDLPGQSRVEFTITGDLDASATGTLENTASATLPEGILEVDPANNSATDDDTVLIEDSGVRITKDLLDVVGDSAPFTLTYQIDVANPGPSFAADALVTDLLNDANLEKSSAQWNCAIIDDPAGGTTCQDGTGALNATIDLSVGSKVRFTLTVDTTSTAIGEVTNKAEVSAPGGSDSVELTSNLKGSADLEIIKTDSLAQATPGTGHQYTITVQNKGPDAVFGARVTDEFPPELENVAWSCEATTPIPGDLEHQFLIGPASVGGGTVVASDDGFHAYQLLPEADRIQVYLRNSVPGLRFGEMNEIETETNGTNDPGDAGGTVENMENPVDMVMSPDGRHVYVLSAPAADSGSSPAIAVFSRSINPAADEFGQLSFAGSTTEGLPSVPAAIAVTDDNVFVAGDADTVSIFERNDSSGLATPVEVHTAGVPADPSALAVDRGDNVLFVGSGSGQDVALLSINVDDSMGDPVGRLGFIETVSLADFNGVVDLDVVPASDHLYVTAAGAGKVSMLRYTDSDGDDLPEPAFFAAYSVPGATASALAPDYEHLVAVGNSTDSLTRFRRDVVSGGLTLEPPELQFDGTDGQDPGLDAPVDLVVSSDGRHVLISTDPGTSSAPLTVYSRRAPDPLFALIETDAEGDAGIDSMRSPTDVAVSRDGEHVYAVSLDDGSLTVFDRSADAGTTDATAGAHLEFQQALIDGIDADGMSEPRFVLVSPDDKSVYVTSEKGDSLAVFRRDDDPDSPGFGSLEFLQSIVDGDTLDGDTVNGLAGARGMAMDRDFTHLYVAGRFDDAIAVFKRNGDLSLSFVGSISNTDDGVRGLDGVRDLTISPDGLHVYAASEIEDSIAVFGRDDSAQNATFGNLTFLQKQVFGVGVRPVSVSASPDGNHVYVAAKNSDSISAFRRVTDPGSSSFGKLVGVQQQFNGEGGIEFMNGPRDIEVSGDGKRVYVAAEFDSSVLVFDRDLNPSSQNFGALSPVAVSRDNVDGIDGLDNIYAVAVSPNSRNVYAAGFDDRSIASFVLGIGSVCTGGGSGAIDDTIVIGAGGFVQYRISSRIRADASGTLTNTASVDLPARVIDDNLANNTSTDTTELVPEADLALTKTNNQVSVVAGEPVTYEIEVTNLGPSNLSHSADAPLTVTDLFDGNPDFEPGSVSWSCKASGSGALTFAESIIDDDAVDSPELGLGGAASVALAADSDGTGPLPELLASVGVTDNALSLFARAPGDGALEFLASVADGDSLDGSVVDTLEGARAVAASPDGAYLYVVSQVDDALSVFSTRHDAGEPDVSGDEAVEIVFEQAVADINGLDQASHVIVSADGEFVYAAGTNDDAIAVFDRDPATGNVTLVEVEQEGVDDSGDAGGTVAGLDGVAYLLISPDGSHLYAVSSTAQAVARFDRDGATGRLSWAERYTGSALDVDLLGASAATVDASGRFLYVGASGADRIVVLERDHDPASATFGTLTRVGETVQGSDGVAGLLGPRGVTLSDDGLHLYAASQASNSVTWFLRDPVSGTLDFGGVLSNQSSSVSGMAGASALTLDVARGQLYVAGTLDAAVVRFERSSDSVCPVSGTGELDAIPIDIAAGGSVTFEVTATVSAETDGALENRAVVEAPAGTDPETGNNEMTDDDVVEVVADLRIRKDDGLAEFDGLDGAAALAGNARSVYVAGSDDDGIGVFGRTDDPGAPEHGALTFASVVRNGEAGVSGLTDVADLALAHDAAHLYAASPADNSLVGFDRDPTTGALKFVERYANGTLGITGLGGAGDVLVSPDDRHLYAAGALDDSIAVFARNADPADPEYGRLEFVGDSQNGVGGVSNMAQPSALAASADGLHVYAVSPVDASVVAFSRNPNEGSSAFGALTFVASYAESGGEVAGLAGAADIVVAPNDVDVYVLGAADGTLARFERDPSTGELAFIGFRQDGVGATTGLAGATAMRMSPDAAHLYVASTDGDGIARFDVQGDGSLEFGAVVSNGDSAPLTGGQVIGLDGVADVLVAPDGDQLYGAAGLDDAVTTFVRDHTGDPATNSGALDFRDVIIDGLGGVAPGSVVTYTIIVDNLGPSDVAQATVVDDFPDSFSSVSWECTPSASPPAACTPGINSGSINDDAVSLPAGGRVTYVASARVREDASGRLVNTATVTGIGLQDPVIANNSATDDDTVLSPSIDLVTDVDDGMTEATPGEPIEYAVSVRNIGPSLAAEVRVSDLIPAALFDVAWSCSATPVEGLLSAGQVVGTPLDAARDLVVPGDGQFAYAAGDAGGVGAVVAYQRDSVTGELSVLETYAEGTQVGDETPVISGLQGASAIVGSADGAFVFVAGSASDSIVAFARDSESGLLTYLAQYRDGEFGIDGLGGVTDLLLGPNGAFLYAAGRIDDAIAIFQLDGATGTLNFTGHVGQGDAGVDGLNGVSSIALSDGHVLAVADDNASLAAFERDAATGSLTPAGIIQNFELAPPTPAAPLNRPEAVLVSEGRIFVAAAGGDAVSEFDFNPVRDPAFELVEVIENAVDGVDGMLGPVSLAFGTRQQRLYVASAGSETVHLFSLRADRPELLAQYSAGDIAGLTGVGSVVLPADNGPLYSLSASAGVGTMARQRGSLCPLGGERELGDHAVELAPGGELNYLVTGRIFANAGGSLVYEVGAESNFVERELNAGDNIGTDTNTLVPHPDLVVTKTDGLDEIVAGTGISYAIDLANDGPSDAIAALFEDSPPVHPEDPGLVSGSAAWSCRANAPLAPDFALGPTDVGSLAGLERVEIAPEGRRLLGINAQLDSVLVFAVDAVDGAIALETTLTEGQTLAGETIQGMSGASAAVESGDGRFVYVAGRASNSVAVLGRTTAGDYTFEQWVESGRDGVAGLLGPEDIVLSADERFVFVASAASDAIAVFARDEDTGQLSFVERVKDGFGTITPDSNVLRGVRRLHATLDGAHLYAAAPSSDSVAVFAVDGDSGELTYIEALQSGDSGVTGMAGAWDLAASPDGRQLYVAARDDHALTTLARDGDTGALSHTATFTASADLDSPVAVELNVAGSRGYLVAGNSTLHVFARDFNDGSLDHRAVFDETSGLPGAPGDLAYTAVPHGVYVAAPDGGDLVRFNELALSRCLTAAGNDDAVALVADFGVDGYGDVSYDAVVHPAARGDLVNLASLTPGSGADAEPSDNAGLDTTTVVAESDIGVTKTGPAEAVAGEPIAYELVVTNDGPSDALGIKVTDTPPAPLTQIQWTCDATAGSECPAEGNGTPNFFATVRVDGELVVTVNAVIDPSFVGLMTNEVELNPEPGSTDPTTVDHTDRVETEVVAVADVSVTKTTLTAPVVAGLPVSWRIDVGNAGPSDAPSVALADTLPAGLNDVTWGCTASGGATCPAPDSDLSATDIALPAGSAIEIEVGAELDAAETGNLVNTVEVTVAEPVTESKPTNNTAATSDPIAVRSDMAVDLVAPRNPFDPGGPIELPLNVEVTNGGPSNSRNVDVVIDFSAPVNQTRPGCTQPLDTRVRCLISQLDPGETRILELSLVGLPQAPATLVADVSVVTSSDDPNAGNDADSVSIELRSGVDLDVSIDNGFDWLSPGQVVDYALVIENIGSQDAFGADVSVPVNPDLLDLSWTCEATGGASCISPGSIVLDETVDIPSGAMLAYTVNVQVDPTLDLSTPVSIAMTAEAGASPPEDDINIDNNLAVDQDEVRVGIFSDGFESDGGESTLRQSVDAAGACFETRLDADDIGGLPRGRVIEGLGADGTALYWMNLSRRGTTPWLQLNVLGAGRFATSGWMPVPDTPGYVAVRIDRDRLALRAGGETLWSSDQTLPAPIERIARTTAMPGTGKSAGSGAAGCTTSKIELNAGVK